MSLFAMKRKKGHPGARQRCPSHLHGSPQSEREQVTAARSLVNELFEEITCPICLEYFQEPVILNCGHNFCQACITQCWGEKGRASSCPQCREISQLENSRPNRHLRNLVELVKKLQEGKEAKGEWEVCERHQHPLELFCRNDQVAICVVCDRSIEHQNHSVLPMEEAFLEYKKELQAQLQFLERERENLKKEKKEKDQTCYTFLEQLKSEKQKTTSAFQRMHDYLEQQERFRLSQMEKIKIEIKKRKKENHDRFSEEISDLSHLITELEGKFQQPETIFVQDPKTLVSRHEKKPERQLLDLPPILEQKCMIYSEQTPELQKALKECEEFVAKALMGALAKKVNITLDPETAHPNLIVSEDLKSVAGGQTAQKVPNNPGRFDTLRSVLGHEKFTSGRHWWEVDLSKAQSFWVVGVVRESVKRKGNVIRNPDEGFWVLWTQGSYDRYYHVLCWKIHAWSSSQSVVLSDSIPQKIWVFLDYEEGLVEFFSADTNTRLFTFPSASFSGEALRPYFSVGAGNTLTC